MSLQNVWQQKLTCSKTAKPMMGSDDHLYHQSEIIWPRNTLGCHEYAMIQIFPCRVCQCRPVCKRTQFDDQMGKMMMKQMLDQPACNKSANKTQMRMQGASPRGVGGGGWVGAHMTLNEAINTLP